MSGDPRGKSRVGRTSAGEKSTRACDCAGRGAGTGARTRDARAAHSGGDNGTCPGAARRGCGDLLAGLIGGLLAQAPTEPLLAACRGVVWHGLAADCLARAQGQTTVQVTQLLDFLLPALRVAAKTE